MPKTTTLPVMPRSAAAALVPAAVRVRLTECPEFFRSQGPVTRSAAGTVTGTLAELAAQAVVHGQQDLAQALIGALSACENLPRSRAA